MWAVLECQVLVQLILTGQFHCTNLIPPEKRHTASDTTLGAHILLKLLEQHWLLDGEEDDKEPKVEDVDEDGR